MSIDKTLSGCFSEVSYAMTDKRYINVGQVERKIKKKRYNKAVRKYSKKLVSLELSQ